MRAVGYFVLLLLALYFIFVKPYLLAKRVHWEIRGLSLSFDRGLSLDEFILYLPAGKRLYYVRIKSASLKPWQANAKEFDLILIFQSPPSDKPFDYDFSGLTRLARSLNISLEKGYISINDIPHGQSYTLFIPSVSLTSGIVFSDGWAKVYHLHGLNSHELEVFLQKAHIEGSRFYIDSAKVRGELYSFTLRGYWEGKRGSFDLEGELKPINKESFYLDTVRFKGKAFVEYTLLEVPFEAESSLLEIKGRRNYRNLSFKGKYVWRWRKESKLSGNLQGSDLSASLEYLPDKRLLLADFSSFNLDSALLKVQKPIRAYLSGSLQLDLNRKVLKLSAFAPLVQTDKENFEKASLRLELDYNKKATGYIELSSAYPTLSLKGNFVGSDFSGSLELFNYPLREELSALLSYTGRVNYTGGILYLSGAGSLKGVSYKGFRVGDLRYELQTKGEDYRLFVQGSGFTLEGTGSLKEKSFEGGLNLMDFAYSYDRATLEGVRGRLSVGFEKGLLSLNGSLEGKLHYENMESLVRAQGELKLSEALQEGFFFALLEKTKIGALQYRRGTLSGRLKGGTLSLSFALEDRLLGTGSYSLKAKSFVFGGSLKEVYKGLGLNLSYRAMGNFQKASLVFEGTGTYNHRSFPIKASLHKEGRDLYGEFEGFELKEGIVKLSFGGLELKGDTSRGRLILKPVAISILNEEYLKLSFGEGSYELDKRRFQIDGGKISGVGEGWLRLAYEEEGGLSLSSEGSVELDRLLNTIKSRIWAEGEGKISYRLDYKGDGLTLSASSKDFELRSRYIAVPMRGDMSLEYRSNLLRGFLELRGGGGRLFNAVLSGDNKGFVLKMEGFALPVIYRNSSARANLLLWGNGQVRSDYKTYQVKGNWEFTGAINLTELKGVGDGQAQEFYKKVLLDIKLSTKETVRLSIPEGYTYIDVNSHIGGSLYEPEYNASVLLKGGSLSYFNKNFSVRRGKVELSNKEKLMDITITTPTPDYTIVIDLRGSLESPRAFVRSEPPRSSEEVLTSLVLGGGSGEGLFSLAGALVSTLPQLSGLLKNAQSATGLDLRVNVSPTVSATGEAGIKVKVSKDITERLQVEYQHSTVKDPKDTYVGGEVKITPSTSIGGRSNSDRSGELRLRFRKKFDF